MLDAPVSGSVETLKAGRLTLMVGAVVLVVVNEFFVTCLGSSELSIAATGLLLALVLLFFPRGIVGSLKEYGKIPGFLDWD